jgi:hypothetical protein
MTDAAASVGGIKARLSHEGFAVVDLLGAAEVQALRDAYRRHARPSQAGFDSTILDADTGVRASVDQAIRKVFEPRLRAAIEGHRLAVCTFAVKHAGRPDGEVPIHQDWSFVDEARFGSLGVWCPLVDVDLGNGCLQVVKGSHAGAHPPRAACSPFLYPRLVETLRASYLTTLPLRAGQAVLFDNRLFHCSPPNASDVDRIAATAVMVPAAARLRYYHMVDRNEPHRVEVFEVSDGFYLSHHAPGRPKNAHSLGIIDIRDCAIQS